MIYRQGHDQSLPTIANKARLDLMAQTITMSIALPEPLRAYVAGRVEAGEYGNTSEYVRELIRKDQQEQRVLRLRALVEERLASGPPVTDTPAD